MNDYSIQRYSLGWKDVIEALDKRYTFKRDESIQFNNELLKQAVLISTGGLRVMLECFARELGINICTLRDKF